MTTELDQALTLQHVLHRLGHAARGKSRVSERRLLGARLPAAHLATSTSTVYVSPSQLTSFTLDTIIARLA